MRIMTTFVLALALTACGTVGTLDNADQELLPLVEFITERHDGYVNADTTLSDAERSAALAESAVFRQAFLAEAVVVAPIYQAAVQVLARHDAYVSGDATLLDDVRDARLFSSRNTRATLDEAMKGDG